MTGESDNTGKYLEQQADWNVGFWCGGDRDPELVGSIPASAWMQKTEKLF